MAYQSRARGSVMSLPVDVSRYGAASASHACTWMCKPRSDDECESSASMALTAVASSELGGGDTSSVSSLQVPCRTRSSTLDGCETGAQGVFVARDAHKETRLRTWCSECSCG